MLYTLHLQKSKEEHSDNPTLKTIDRIEAKHGLVWRLVGILLCIPTLYTAKIFFGDMFFNREHYLRIRQFKRLLESHSLGNPTRINKSKVTWKIDGMKICINLSNERDKCVWMLYDYRNEKMYVLPYSESLHAQFVQDKVCQLLATNVKDWCAKCKKMRKVIVPAE